MNKLFVSRISRLSIVRKLGILVDFIVNYHWNTFPFGHLISKKKEEYIELWKHEKINIYPEIDQYEKNTGYKINKSWLDNLALHTQVVIKPSPLCWQHGRVLYSSLSSWIAHSISKDVKVVTIWETGTARGFSAICMAKALEDSGKHGRIVTFDVLPHHKKILWNCIDDIQGKKSRLELLKPWEELSSNYVIFQQGDSMISLAKTAVDRINFAFLDGSHTYKDVMFEFNQISDYQEKGDVIVFDDYAVSQFPGLVQAVDEICSDYSYNRLDIKANSWRSYVVATKE